MGEIQIVDASHKSQRGSAQLSAPNGIARPLNVTSISRVIRPLKGGSQSRLVQCEGGRFWIAKFLGNPQGNRTLINEVIAYRFLVSLQVSTPDLCLLHLPGAIQKDQKIHFLVDKGRTFPEGAMHLGSRCPVDPETTAIFDILPTRSLPKVSNIDEFAMMFVLDRLLHLVDKRQAIFYRDRRSGIGPVAYKTQFIDHGHILGGNRWELADVPGYGLYIQRDVYSLIDMRTLTSDATTHVAALAEGILSSVVDTIPADWFGPDDDEALGKVLDAVLTRKTKLEGLVHRHLDSLGL